MHSKKIGNDWERQVAYFLSEWFTGQKQELVVWRNINSGSLSTKRIKKNISGENIDGDILCLDPKYKKFFETFHIDAKSYSQINFCFINSKNQKSNQILAAWLKTSDEALKVNKLPLMFVKIRDGKTPNLIFYPTTLNLTKNFIFINLANDVKTMFKIGLLEDFEKENYWEDLIL